MGIHGIEEKGFKSMHLYTERRHRVFFGASSLYTFLCRYMPKCRVLPASKAMAHMYQFINLIICSRPERKAIVYVRRERGQRIFTRILSTHLRSDRYKTAKVLQAGTLHAAFLPA